MPKVLVAVSAMISGSNEVSVLISLIHFWTFHNQIRLKQYDILAYLNLSFSPPSPLSVKSITGVLALIGTTWLFL